MPGSMMARACIALLAAALVTALHAPATAQQESIDDLRDTRSDLDNARSSLDDLEGRLDEAQAALAEVDARLAGATSHLHELEQRLAEAEAARVEAAERARRAGAKVADADAQLAAVVDAWEASQDQFDARVAAAYKHGTPWGASLLTNTILEARDLHEVAVNVRAVQSIMNEDLRAMRQARELSLEAVEARRELGELRRAALDQQAEADAARDAVAAVVDRQEAVITQIEAQRAERQGIIDAVAADRQQVIALIGRLTELTARLTGQLNADLAAEANRSFDGPMPEWASRLPQSGRVWARPITGAAARAGVSPQLFAALVWAESYFQPAAVSRAGAVGMSQLMPATAAGLGVDPWDPVQNLVGGARYLGFQINRFGQVDLALAAYNAGPTAVERAGRKIPNIVETQLYVLRVLEYWERILGL